MLQLGVGLPLTLLVVEGEAVAEEDCVLLTEGVPAMINSNGHHQLQKNTMQTIASNPHFYFCFKNQCGCLWFVQHDISHITL